SWALVRARDDGSDGIGGATRRAAVGRNAGRERLVVAAAPERSGDGVVAASLRAADRPGFAEAHGGSARASGARGGRRRGCDAACAVDALRGGSRAVCGNGRNLAVAVRARRVLSGAVLAADDSAARAR